MAARSFATFFSHVNSPAGCKDGGDGQLPASGFRRDPHGDESGGSISRFAWLAKLFAISPEMGADTIVYLASSPAVAETTSEYFYKRQPIAPSPAAQDDRVAALLWERSAALAGLKA